MTRFFSLLLIFAVSLGSTTLLAQDPIISIQGTLKDANGASVADGERGVIFRLYDVPIGGTALWEETATVNVIGGIYSHNLGTVTPLVEANFVTNVFLGVEVGGLELSPRTEMTYAPYALSVQAAQTIAKLGCSGQVGDIKYSILNPTQFAEQNGDCWIPMDGRAIPGTALAGYGHANVPDMSGLFIRATEYNDGNDPDRSPMAPATLQGDENKEHDHYVDLITSTDGDHNHTTNIGYETDSENSDAGNVQNYARNFPEGSDNRTSSTNGDHNHSVQGNSNVSGGAEARPKNMNFYIYIRVD
ncbi:MAG: hypothetical protein AAGF89_10475 [Bacteroidota bacterium]